MRYATLKQHTWLYRRHYPKDVKAILGADALKQSLKTGDIKVAQERVAEINVRFDETVRRIQSGLSASVERPAWAKEMEATVRGIDWSPIAFADLRKSAPVSELARVYLRMKAAELEASGFKSLRYSVNLFASRHGDTLVASLGRDDGPAFLSDIANLSASLGKSLRYHNWSLEALLAASAGCNDQISVASGLRSEAS